jgi:TM2 domain-containing membrane protein YozV
MKIFLKFISILLLCVNTISANAYVPVYNTIVETIVEKDTINNNVPSAIITAPDDIDGTKSRFLAVVLAIVGGVIGLHDFYMEKWGRGGIKFVMGLVGFFISVVDPALGYAIMAIPIIWGLIDALLIANNLMQPKKYYVWRNERN